MTEKTKPAKSGSRSKINYSILADAVGYQVRLAQLKIFSDFISTFEHLQLRPTEFSTLLLLSVNPGLKMRELAEALGIQRANFVAMADMLENRGLAERQKSESDRRIQRLFLTPHGVEFVKDMMVAWETHENRMIEALGGKEQRDQLLVLLSRLTRPRPKP